MLPQGAQGLHPQAQERQAAPSHCFPHIVSAFKGTQDLGGKFLGVTGDI